MTLFYFVFKIIIVIFTSESSIWSAIVCHCGFKEAYNYKAFLSWIDIIICSIKNNTSILNTQRAFCGLWMVLSAFEYAFKNTEDQSILFLLKVKVGLK